MSDRKENKRRRYGLPTQMSLVIRIAAGLYLLYLAYSMFNAQAQMQGTERVVFIGALLLFAVIGGVLIFTSLRGLQRGEYVGGAADVREDNKDVREDNKKEEEK